VIRHALVAVSNAVSGVACRQASRARQSRRHAAPSGPEGRDGQDRLRIDPLSGLLAAVGVNQLKSYQFLAEKFSGAGTRPA
jgi:branched-chain amino acid transport system substrate-binding protein